VRVRFAIAFAVLCCGASAANAADVYQGRQIRLIVSTPPSGAYDIYARMLAPIMAAHIPGKPAIYVENMGGSAGMQASNYLANSAPKDGTVIGAVQNNIPTAPILSPEIAKFDASAFQWIGSVTSDPFIGYVWKDSKLQTYEEAKAKEFIMGAPAVRSFSGQMALISNRLFGTKFKLVIGYPGSNDVKLAMERGEIDGTFGNSWNSVKTQAADWVRDHKIRIITQFGLTPHPDLAGVPMFIDQAKTPDDRALLELLAIQQVFAKPYLAPPGVPADRVAILRTAFIDAVKDPAFLGAMKKANLDVLDPLSGEEVAALVAKAARTPPAIVKRATDIFDAPQKP
jgi:tripartite-type tricarboxylate transporter receptor subunit TctC